MSGVVPPLFYVSSRSEQGERSIRHIQKRVTQFDSTEKQVNPFYILLTVQHLDVILANDQLDALFLNVFISCLYMFRAQLFIIRRVKLY
jgi:hypothetical protein